MYTGSCLCGAVRYDIHGDVDDASICWCTMCQKQHGAANGPYVSVASNALRIVAGLDAITRYASSPGVERAFCGVCGSRLTRPMAEHSERIAVTLGTFDTPCEGRVTHELHTESKPGWLP